MRYLRAVSGMLGRAIYKGHAAKSGVARSQVFTGDGCAVIILSGVKRVYNFGIDAGGQLYLPQFLEGTVLKLSPSCDLLSTLYGPVGGWHPYSGQSSLFDQNKPDVGLCFHRPHAVTLDGDGNLYVAEYQAGRIGKFTAGGELIRYMGTPSDPVVLQGPVVAWPEHDGHVYVGDAKCHVVVRYRSDGTFAGWMGAGSGGSVQPGFRFDRLETVASAEPGGFNNPHLARYGPDGNLYVADTGNNRMQKFTTDGHFVAWLGEEGGNVEAVGWRMQGLAGSGARLGALASPISFDFDANGNLYVVENKNCRVQKFASNGRAIAWFGRSFDGAIGWQRGDASVSGNEPGAFKFPSDVRIFRDQMYVSDTHNARVQIVSLRTTRMGQLSGGVA